MYLIVIFEILAIIYRCPAPPQAVWAVRHHDLGDWLASCSLDHSVRLWDLVACKSRQVLRGHVDSVNECAWQPFTNNLCTGEPLYCPRARPAPGQPPVGMRVFTSAAASCPVLLPAPADRSRSSVPSNEYPHNKQLACVRHTASVLSIILKRFKRSALS